MSLHMMDKATQKVTTIHRRSSLRGEWALYQLLSIYISHLKLDMFQHPMYKATTTWNENDRACNSIHYAPLST